MEMEMNDILEIEYLIKLTMAKKEDAHRMENFLKKFIDPKASVCPHCSGQIKFAHKRIVNYWEQNATSISQRKQQLLNPTPQKKESFEEGCSGCGKELKDKRYKYCSKNCKDNAKK